MIFLGFTPTEKKGRKDVSLLQVDPGLIIGLTALVVCETGIIILLIVWINKRNLFVMDKDDNVRKERVSQFDIFEMKEDRHDSFDQEREVDETDFKGHDIANFDEDETDYEEKYEGIEMTSEKGF